MNWQHDDCTPDFHSADHGGGGVHHHPFDKDNVDDDVDDVVVNGKNSGRVNIYCARWRPAILQNASRPNSPSTLP